jgi:hypothetical protein
MDTNPKRFKVLTPIFHKGKQYMTGEIIEISPDMYEKYFQGRNLVKLVNTPATEPEKKEEVTEVKEPGTDTPATEPEKKVNKKQTGVN